MMVSGIKRCNLGGLSPGFHHSIQGRIPSGLGQSKGLHNTRRVLSVGFRHYPLLPLSQVPKPNGCVQIWGESNGIFGIHNYITHYNNLGAIYNGNIFTNNSDIDIIGVPLSPPANKPGLTGFNDSFGAWIFTAVLFVHKQATRLLL